jgi:hypothetical protein
MERPSRGKTLAEDGLSDSPAREDARWGATGHEPGERAGGAAAQAHGLEAKGGSAAEYLQAIMMSSKNKTAQMLRSAAAPGEGLKVAWAAQGRDGGSNVSSPARALTLSTLAPSAPSAALSGSEGRLHTRIADLERQLIEEGAKVRHLEAHSRSKDQQVFCSFPPLPLPHFSSLILSLPPSLPPSHSSPGVSDRQNTRRAQPSILNPRPPYPQKSDQGNGPCHGRHARRARGPPTAQQLGNRQRGRS